MQILMATLSLIVARIRNSTLSIEDILLPIMIISLIGTVSGGLFTILGSVLRKVAEHGIILYRANLLLICFVLLFTALLFGVYLISNNSFALIVGAAIGAILPFVYGYYAFRKKEKDKEEHNEVH